MLTGGWQGQPSTWPPGGGGTVPLTKIDPEFTTHTLPVIITSFVLKLPYKSFKVNSEECTRMSLKWLLHKMMITYGLRGYTING